jgi:serine/threonine-protein kinase RsbW
LKCLDLAIDSELGNVTLMAVAVNRVCLELGLDALRAGEIELCIVEAATNAIQHGYQSKPGHIVTAKVSIQCENLIIEVIDTGTPIPSDNQQMLLHGPKACDEQAIEWHSLSEGGRGLKIIHELMEKVSYVSGNGHNRLIMTAGSLRMTGNTQ